jgi:hypothetical protein
MSRRADDQGRDQDQQQAVRPVPDRVVAVVKVGQRVTTLRGPGVVRDVIVSLSKWADDKKQITPPQVVVELDEPWDGQILITTYLHQISPPGSRDKIFEQPAKKLWPDQIPEQPAVTLRPTERVSLKVSELIRRRLAETDLCPLCGEKMDEGEDLCESCQNKATGAPLSFNFNDPNGVQFFTETQMRRPIVPWKFPFTTVYV